MGWRFKAYQQIVNTTHEAMVRWAQEEDRLISNLVVRVVSKAVEEREKQQNPPQ